MLRVLCPVTFRFAPYAMETDMHALLIHQNYLKIRTVSDMTADKRSAMLGNMSRLAATIRRMWRRRRTIAILQRLDDRILNDIGIVRADIPGYADRCARNRITMVGTIAQ